MMFVYYIMSWLNQNVYVLSVQGKIYLKHKEESEEIESILIRLLLYVACLCV